jgi:hypothetical protein
MLVINGAMSFIPVFGFAGPAAELKTIATHSLTHLIDVHIKK